MGNWILDPSRQGPEFADYYRKGGNRLPNKGDLKYIEVMHTLERTEPWDEILADIEQSLEIGGTVVFRILDHDAFYDATHTGPNIEDVYVGIFGREWRKESTHIRKMDVDKTIEVISQFGLVRTSNIVEDGLYTVVEFRKPRTLSTVDYAAPEQFPLNGKILEIGPGAYPLLRADVYFDHDQQWLDKLSGQTNKQTVKGDLKDGLPFEDKEFEYVWCSHVIEHLDDPIAALKEISRVGKAGAIMAPSIFKEFLSNYEEDDHKWDILPPAFAGGPIRFIRPDFNWRSRVKDKDVQSALCGAFRTDRYYTRRERLLRNWFTSREPLLDVVVHWTGEVNGIVL